MADLRPIHAPHKSLFRIFCKSILFIIFLIAIPLFPSQAPDFVSQSLFTKFWELFHLLFIGIAVCYGLFSSRNLDADFDTTNAVSNFDFDLQSSNNYVSRLFHVSPIFEDRGFDHLSGPDVKDLYSQSYVSVSNSMDGQTKIDGTQISAESDENGGGLQAWSSHFLQTQPVAVLSQVNYELNEWGKHCQGVGHKPLGLPVRSLKSKVWNPDSPQFSDGSESGSSFISGSSYSGRSFNENGLGDMGSINLEEKFNESFRLHSQVPLRSRSQRVDTRENVGQVVTHPAHFRPLSVDETQFESFKSQSFRSATSLSSQASSISNSPSMLSPSHSASSDSPRSRIDNLGKNDDFFASSPPVSQPPQATKTRDAPLNAFHLRKYSTGSLFQKDSRKSSKDASKNPSGKSREGLLGIKESGQGPSESAKKPAAMDKATPRGKSVRTVRSNVYSVETAKAEEVERTQMDEHDVTHYNEAKTASHVGKMKRKKECPGSRSSSISKSGGDGQYDVPKPIFGKYQMKEKEEALETVTVQNSKIESVKSQARSVEGVAADSEIVSDAGHDSEVDRKAGEFIAKFREQIRLQKVASVERSKGLWLSGKHLSIYE